MIIWGYRRYIQQLAMLTLLCGNCGNPAAHALKRAVTKFTLFFIPLFPISSKYFTQCTFCGATRRVPKEEVSRLQAQGNQPYPQQDQSQPGYPQGPQSGYQQPGYPQAQQPGYQQAPQPGYPQHGQPYQAQPQSYQPYGQPAPQHGQPGYPQQYQNRR